MTLDNYDFRRYLYFMLIANLLLIVGFFLVFLEFFLPGGLIAILGGASIVSAITVFSMLKVAISYKILFFALSILGTIAICKLAILTIRRQKIDSICLDRNQEGYTASFFEKELIGEIGEVLTDLKPSGHIQIGSHRVQALSEGPYIQKGASVRVEGGRGAYLIVREE